MVPRVPMLSASAIFGTRLRTKAEARCRSLRRLALAASRNNDRARRRVGHRPRRRRFVPPRRARRHVLRIINDLLAFEPRHRGNRPCSRVCGLPIGFCGWCSVGFGFGFSYHRPRCRWSGWPVRHTVVALQLSDQRERELPDLGLITLFDPESAAPTGWWIPVARKSGKQFAERSGCLRPRSAGYIRNRLVIWFRPRELAAVCRAAHRLLQEAGARPARSQTNIGALRALCAPPEPGGL